MTYVREIAPLNPEGEGITLHCNIIQQQRETGGAGGISRADSGRGGALSPILKGPLRLTASHGGPGS